MDITGTQARPGRDDLRPERERDKVPAESQKIRGIELRAGRFGS